MVTTSRSTTHITLNQASVHGYWIKEPGNVSCPPTAIVTVDLQAWACAAIYGCTWITQETDSGEFTAGGGSGNWGTPHKDCVTHKEVGWRGQADVNLVGIPDPLGYSHGAAHDWSCSPE